MDRLQRSKESEYTSYFNFTINDPEAIVELEIRLSNTDPLGRYNNEALFFDISHETFLIERSNIMPSELFYLNAVDDTLTLSTTVI